MRTFNWKINIMDVAVPDPDRLGICGCSGARPIPAMHGGPAWSSSALARKGSAHYKCEKRPVTPPDAAKSPAMPQGRQFKLRLRRFLTLKRQFGQLSAQSTGDLPGPPMKARGVWRTTSADSAFTVDAERE